MPLYIQKNSVGVSKLHGTSQSKHKINNEGKTSCLESKEKQPVHIPERGKQLLPTKPQHPTSESRLQGLATTVHSSPTGFLPDLHKSKHKLKPQIIGRVMSEIHSNLPHKDFASEDFLHVLVDRVIKEVANEINLYDEGAPLIYPALAQTNMLPQQSYHEKTESLVSSHIYEEQSNSSFEVRKPPNKVEQREELNAGEGRKSHPSEITVSVVLSESSSDSTTSECSVECCPEDPPKFYQKFKAKAKRLFTSRTFWCTIFLLLFILFMLLTFIIIGAFIGLAICGPYSCSRTWQSPNTFHWHYLLKPQPQDTLDNMHGLF